MPAVEVMEFGKVYSSRCCTHRSKVAGRVESGEVKIIEKSKDRSGYVVIEERQEAFEIEPIPTREALMAAVMSGDWTLADRMARAYQLHPFDPRVPRSNNILAMLRDLIVGDDEAARQCLTKFTHKYPRDRASPVYREELMIGIIDRNEDLLREGLKQTNKRFDTVWNLKNYEKPRSLKQFDSVQSLHESCVRDLLRFRWAISIFAVAMMRIAVRRGLTALLNEPECWSDWVPFELVT